MWDYIILEHIVLDTSWTYSNMLAWPCAKADENGHFELLKCARANGCPWEEWTCSNAAENGHLELLKALLLTCKEVENEAGPSTHFLNNHLFM